MQPRHVSCPSQHTLGSVHLTLGLTSCDMHAPIQTRSALLCSKKWQPAEVLQCFLSLVHCLGIGDDNRTSILADSLDVLDLSSGSGMHHGRHGCLDWHAQLGEHGGHGGAESAQAAQINLHLQVALLQAPKAACAARV